MLTHSGRGADKQMAFWWDRMVECLAGVRGGCSPPTRSWLTEVRAAFRHLGCQDDAARQSSRAKVRA